MSTRTSVTELEQTLRAAGDPARAVKEKAYLKSELRFFGSGMPAIRATARDFAKTNALDHDQLVSLVDALTTTDVHELRSVAIGLLERKRKLLTTADLPWLIDVVRRCPGWAYVDWLAAKIIGPLLQDTPEMTRRLCAWAKDPDLWVRRTALLAQLDALRAGEGDFELFTELATPLLPEKDFWIRKAIGWVLREVVRKRPELVVAYVKAQGDAMSGLTFREATRNLPDALKPPARKK